MNRIFCRRGKYKIMCAGHVLKTIPNVQIGYRVRSASVKTRNLLHGNDSLTEKIFSNSVTAFYGDR